MHIYMNCMFTICRKLLPWLFVALFTIIFSASAFSQTRPTVPKTKVAPVVEVPAVEVAVPKKEKEKSPYVLKPGVLAGWGNYGNEESSDFVGNNGMDLKGSKSVPPLAASLSHYKGSVCHLKVTNSDPENSYSVRLQVVGVDKNGRTKIKQTYGMRVSADSEKRRDVKCKQDYSMRVSLKSGKAL